MQLYTRCMIACRKCLERWTWYQLCQ